MTSLFQVQLWTCVESGCRTVECSSFLFILLMLYLNKNNYLHCALGEIKNKTVKCINEYICVFLVFELENMKKITLPSQKKSTLHPTNQQKNTQKNPQPNKIPSLNAIIMGTTLTCKY